MCTENTNTAETRTQDEVMVNSYNEIKEARKMLDSAQEQMTTVAEMAEFIISMNGFDADAIKEKLMFFVDRGLPEISPSEDGAQPIIHHIVGDKLSIDVTEDEIEQIIRCGNSEFNLDNAISDATENSEDDEEITPLDAKIHAISEVLKTLSTLNDLNKEIEEIKANLDKQVKIQYDYLNSAEYAKKMADRLNELKTEMENETDPDKKKRLESVINTFKAMNSLEYIFKRLNVMGDKEASSVVDKFFNGHDRSYILRKFEDKAQKLGIHVRMYAYFLHLETSHLPEAYHPFENFFLFCMMRMIMHTDIYNKTDVMYSKNIIRNLQRLKYHEFPSEEAEETFKNVIMTYLDHFMKYRDRFCEENQAYIDFKNQQQANEESAQVADATPEESEEEYITDIVSDEDGVDDTCDHNQQAINEIQQSCEEALHGNTTPIREVVPCDGAVTMETYAIKTEPVARGSGPYIWVADYQDDEDPTEEI